MQTKSCSNSSSLIHGAQIVHINDFEGNLHFLALNTFLLIPLPFLLLDNLVILPSLTFTIFSPLPPPWHFYCFTSIIITITFLLFSLQHHHHISTVFPPAPPPTLFCLTSPTTIILLFSLLHHHHHYISIVFSPPPPSTLFLFNFHQHQHHISIALPPPPSNRLLKEKVKQAKTRPKKPNSSQNQAKGRKGITGHLYNLSIWWWWWENNKHFSYFIFIDLKITKQPVQPVRPPKK